MDLFDLCVCVCMHTCVKVLRWRSEKNLRESGLNQEGGLGGECLSSLIHFVSTKDSLIVTLRGSFPELL